MKYFKKEILSNPWKDRHGRFFPWEALGQNTGVAALDETNPEKQEVIEDLEKSAARRQGGIIIITQEKYDELKKTRPYLPSEPASEMLRVFNPPKPSQSGDHAPAVVSKAPETQTPTTPVPSTPAPSGQSALPRNFIPRTARAGQNAGRNRGNQQAPANPQS